MGKHVIHKNVYQATSPLKVLSISNINVRDYGICTTLEKVTMTFSRVVALLSYLLNYHYQYLVPHKIHKKIEGGR